MVRISVPAGWISLIQCPAVAVPASPKDQSVVPRDENIPGVGWVVWSWFWLWSRG